MDPELVLRALGIGLMAIAVAIVLVDASNEDLQTNRTVGVVFRTIALPLIVAAIGHHIFRRARGETGYRWSELTPEAVAFAGLFALILALFLGAPGRAGATTPEEMADSVQECKESGADPATALPGVRTVSAREAAQIPGAAASFQQYSDMVSLYETGGARDATFIAMIAVGESDEDHADVERGFVDGYLSQGLAQTSVDLGETTAVGFGPQGADPIVFFARAGCYAFSIWGNSTDATLEQARAMTGSA